MGLPRALIALLPIALTVFVLVALSGSLPPSARALAQGGTAEPVAVTNIRLGDHGDMTRFVADLSRPAAFVLTSLESPPRITIDLPGAEWQERGASAGGARRGLGLIASHRIDAGGDGVRLILEMGRTVRVRDAFLLGADDGLPPRLVIDVVPTGQFASQHLAVAVQDLTNRPRIDAVARTLPTAAPPPAAVTPAATPPLPPEPPTGDPIAALLATDASNGGAPSTTDSQLAALPSPPPAAAPPAAAIPPQLAGLPLPPPTPDRSWQIRTIVIDAGHGGIDPGAIGPAGTTEKQITLAIALRLRDALEARGHYRVVLTRDRDVMIRLRERVRIAREANADLFISLHADSIGNAQVRGASVYTLSDVASDREAEQLAARENRADALAGVVLDAQDDLMASILIDLAQRLTRNESNSFADLLVNRLADETRLLPNPHRQAGFAVLTAPDVPSVLLEMGYLSSRADEQQLNSPDHQERLSHAIADAIDSYFRWLEEVHRS